MMLFICTSNTCRSAMAQAFFRALDGQCKCNLIAQSAGLYTVDGLPVNNFAHQSADMYGADISHHNARLLTVEMAQQAQYIVCMTAAQRDRLCELFPVAQDKIQTLDVKDISDPFGCDLGQYQICAKQIYVAVEKLIQRLENTA